MARYQTLLQEDRGAVRLITLNQPELFNPLDAVSGRELVAALERADRQADVRAVVLTGAGKAYAAGGNVKVMAELLAQGERPGPWFSDIGATLNRSIITLRRLSKPVVCALNGVAAGGGLGWALGCDLIVAARSARLDPAYVRIAVCPDGGASVLITRIIGHKRASELFLRGRVLNMEEALAWGLVNKVVDDDQVLAEALAWAQELAEGPAEALAATKRLLNQAVLGDLETLLENERQAIARLSESPDFAEGVRAFFERRKPRFA